MKIVLSCLCLLAAAGGAQVAFGAPGDAWSLSGDMQVASNPSPPIDPGLPGGGTGTWTYFHDGGNFVTSTTNVPADANPELPNGGMGWVLTGANHISLIKFSVDANPIPPTGTGDDKTNFLIGDVGGHASIGASWTTDHAGTFLAQWFGYNGRDQRTASPNEQGRATTLRMTSPGGDLDVQMLVGGGGFDGSANAYTKSAVLTLAAGDVLRLGQEGGEWCGLDLRVTEIPEPSSCALLAIGGAVLAVRQARRRR